MAHTVAGCGGLTAYYLTRDFFIKSETGHRGSSFISKSGAGVIRGLNRRESYMTPNRNRRRAAGVHRLRRLSEARELAQGDCLRLGN
eukprot:738520-Hanusia_phi.AAC.1